MGRRARRVMRLRARQVRLLAAPLWHARAWSLIPLSALIVLVGVVALRLLGRTVDPAAVGAVAGLLLAGSAAYGLDDPSALSVAALPAPLRFRTGLRVGGVLLLAGGCWGVVLGLVAATPGVALARPTLLFAVLVAVSMLAGQRYGGAAGGPAVFGFLLVGWQVPYRWSVVEDAPGTGTRLTALLVVACVALVAGSRDPAARSAQG